MAAAAIIAARNMKKLQAEREANWTEEDIRRMYEEDKRQAAEALITHYNKYQDQELYAERPCLQKYLVHVANPLQRLTEGERFNLFIIGIIMAAGLIVGLQTDKYCETLYEIFIIDWIILGIFTFEVVAKIIAEGFAPWRYWVGPEYKWNNFDFIIVLLSYPNPVLAGGGAVKLLRLVRLARLAKLIKKIPQLQMIVMGLFGGLKSISYIMLLLFIVMYLFAIIGIMIFGANDRFHFGNLRDAIITLFRACTLEDWTDIMYINFFGCDGLQYDSGMYHLKSLGREGKYHPDGCPVLCHAMNDPLLGKEVGINNHTGRGHGVIWRENSPTIGTNFGAIGMLYWHVYIGIAALVMLSLFIGAVTMSMTTSMNDMKADADRSKRIKNMLRDEEKKKQREEKRLKKLEERARRRSKNGLERQMTAASQKIENDLVNDAMDEEDIKVEKLQTRNLFKLAWDSTGKVRMIDYGEIAAEKRGFLCLQYYRLARVSKKIADHTYFVNLITIVICIAGFMVGVQTETNEFDPRFASCKPGCGASEKTNFTANILNIPSQAVDSSVDCVKTWEVTLDCHKDCIVKDDFLLFMEACDLMILVIFTIEVVVKIVAQFDKPWKYFYNFGSIDGWNSFDFFIVVGSLIPSDQGGMLVILRLLRLLRVLKLMKAFPELQIIVGALIQGLGSISYIAMILVLVFFAAGIGAMILFQENDPWHFNTLPNAMYSLFRASTLEDWTDIMYTNMYGCANYGAFPMCEDVGQPNCAARMDNQTDLTVFHDLYCCCREKSMPQMWGGFLFFATFVVIGAMVLMTLFVGVITTAMEEAQSNQKLKKIEESEEAEQIAKLGISSDTIWKYRQIFNLMDEDRSGSIDYDELQTSLDYANMIVDLETVYKNFGISNDQECNFVQYLGMMHEVRKIGRFAVGDESLHPDDDNSRPNSPNPSGEDAKVEIEMIANPIGYTPNGDQV